MSTQDVRDRVQAFLTKNLSVNIDHDGDFSVRFESARVFVSVRDWRNGESTLVSLFSPVVRGARPSAELDSYVARHADDYVFGHLSLWDDKEDGTVGVMLSHNLLGDYLDEDELLHAVAGIAHSANELDDELVAQFGGRVFHDE